VRGRLVDILSSILSSGRQIGVVKNSYFNAVVRFNLSFKITKKIEQLSQILLVYFFGRH